MHPNSTESQLSKFSLERLIYHWQGLFLVFSALLRSSRRENQLLKKCDTSGCEWNISGCEGVVSVGELAGTARRHILSLAAPAAAAAAAAPKPQILLQPSAAHPPSSLPPPPPMLLTIPPLHFIIRLLSGHLPALDTTRRPDLNL